MIHNIMQFKEKTNLTPQKTLRFSSINRSLIIKKCSNNTERKVLNFHRFQFTGNSIRKSGGKKIHDESFATNMTNKFSFFFLFL